MKRFVLDASIALSWFIDHPVAPYATYVKQLLLSGDRALVPVLWFHEVANGFLVTERRRQIAADDTLRALQELDIVLAHAIEVSQEPISVRRSLALAGKFQLSAYDGVYLQLAQEYQLALATLDQQLVKAAAQAGVQMVQ